MWRSVGSACLALAQSAETPQTAQFGPLSLLLDASLRGRVSVVWRVSLRVWRVSECLLHMWTCSTDVSWLPGRRALLPLAFLAVVVTWWHTVASGVQTGSPRANMIQSSTSVAPLRPPTTLKHVILRRLRREHAGFVTYCTNRTLHYFVSSISWNLLKMTVRVVCTFVQDILTVVRWEFVYFSPKSQKHLTSWTQRKRIGCYWLYNYWVQRNSFQAPHCCIV